MDKKINKNIKNKNEKDSHHEKIGDPLEKPASARSPVKKIKQPKQDGASASVTGSLPKKQAPITSATPVDGQLCDTPQADAVSIGQCKKPTKKHQQKPRALTYKQHIFIKEMADGVSGAEAVRRAGFKSNRPDAYAYVLLRKDEIRDAIDVLRAERLKKYDITAERVLEEIAILGYQNAQNLFDSETGLLIPINKLPERVARTIASIEVVESPIGDGVVEQTTKLKTWDKKGSLELLGKHLKLFTDNHEFPGGINIGAIAIKINHVYPDSKKLTLQDRSGDVIETGARD